MSRSRRTRRTLNPASGPTPPSRRGIVEIELLLTVTLIILILFLIRGAMNIALTRMDTAQTASVSAFRNVLTGPAPQYIAPAGLPVVDGITSVRPGLPNRVHAPRPRGEVIVQTGTALPIPPISIGGRSGLIGPFWSYSAHPFNEDREPTERWFLEYVNESHAQFVVPLMLAPPWPP